MNKILDIANRSNFYDYQIVFLKDRTIIACCRFISYGYRL